MTRGGASCPTGWPCSGSAVIVVLVLLAAFARPCSRRTIRSARTCRARSPGRLAEFPLGTDEFGRCILAASSTARGSRCWSACIATAHRRGRGHPARAPRRLLPARSTASVMRSMDVLLAFPSILLAIAIVAALGPSLPNVMIAVGIRSIPSFARLTPLDGARPQGARVRPGRPRAGRRAPARALPPHPPQQRLAAARLLLDAGGDRDPARRDPVVPRPRRAAADARSGGRW